MIARVRRYGDNVGRLGLAQFLAIMALFGWIMVTASPDVRGVVAGALASAFFLMWLVRPLLLHKPAATSRVLNFTAMVVLGVVLVNLGGFLALPGWVWLALLVAVPLHIAANFWFYSDEGVMTSRRLQTMMRRAPSSHAPAEGQLAGDGVVDDEYERAETL